MRHLSRIMAALLLGGLSLVAGGIPAQAAAAPCVEEADGYPATGVCAVTVTKAETVCLNGVLELTYAVSSEPESATSVDLRWVNPAGAVFVQTEQPLSGTVIWPASIPKVALDLQFVAGATATVRVDPAAANAACSTSTSRVLSAGDPNASASSRVLAATSSRVLAATGADVLPFVVVGGGLLLVGAALLVTRTTRNRRLHSEQ